MPIEFKLPDIGEGVAEGEITRWMVADGDAIREDQPMVEVMTDKATVEITSPVTGRVQKILHPAGAVVPVHSAIVLLEKEGEAAGGGGDARAEKPAAEPPPRAKAPAGPPRREPARGAPEGERPREAAERARPEAARDRKAQPPRHEPPAEPRRPAADEPSRRPAAAEPPRRAPAPAEEHPPRDAAAAAADAGERKVLATPATRKLARELGIDLRGVEGTGPRGRVTKDDVQATAAPRAEAAPARGETAAARAATPRAAPAPVFDEAGEERTAYRGIRKAIGDQMVRSKLAIPHFTYVEEMDLGALYDLRKEAAALAGESGVKFTFLPLIIKALCSAIRRFPMVNSHFREDEGEIVTWRDVHVGVATDTERGLLVPVVRNADRKTAMVIAQDLQDLSERARDGSITREELKGSTITITSAGSIGGLFATPIINHPEVAILGVYQIKDKPVVRAGQVVPGKVGCLSITLDHRVIDGATAAHFMNHMKRLLEDPRLLAIES